MFITHQPASLRHSSTHLRRRLHKVWSHCKRVRANCHTAVAAVAVASVVVVAPTGMSAQTLGSAQSFAVLGAEAVTNTNATTIKGDLGVWSGTSLTGMGSVTIDGSFQQTTPVAQQAQADATTMYNWLAALPFTSDLSGQELAGRTLSPGVYFFSSEAQLNGALTLDFASNPGGAFVFQIGTKLTTGSGSTVSVLNGSALSSVFWQVGSDAGLFTGTSFQGNIIAGTSVVLQSGTTIICGRAIALTAIVTMDNNVVSNDCSNGGDYETGGTDYGSLGYSGGSANVVNVPEPSSLSLVAGGLLLFGAVLRRRQRGLSLR